MQDRFFINSVVLLSVHFYIIYSYFLHLQGALIQHEYLNRVGLHVCVYCHTKLQFCGRQGINVFALEICIYMLYPCPAIQMN